MRRWRLGLLTGGFVVVGLLASQLLADEVKLQQIEPSPAVELSCSRPLLPVLADKFCTFKGSPFLEGATIYAYAYRPDEKDADAGRLTIKVKQDTSLFIGITWENARSDTPWGREVLTRDALRKAGWRIVSALYFDDPTRPTEWVYWRPCHAGEQLVLRTRKAYPPLVLVPRDAKVNPMTTVPSEAMNGWLYRSVLQSKVDYLLHEHQWQELEKMAAEFRKSKKRLENGSEMLAVLYEGCLPPTDPELCAAKQKLLEAWLEAEPKSAAAHIALARYLERRAWQARGVGFAYTVTPEGSRSFSEYVAQSESLVEKASALAEKDACLYDVQVQLAIDSGYPPQKLKQLLLDCHALDPQHTAPFVDAARYFQTRWHGGPGDVERYALWAADQVGEPKGNVIYFHIVRAMRFTHGTAVLSEYKFDWPRIKQGALEDLRLHPTATATHGQLAEYAFFQGDRETAREQLAKFEQYPMYSSHWDGTPLDLLRTWARDDYLQGEQEAVYEITRSPILALDWSTDTSRWLVFDNNGDVQFVDSNTGKQSGAKHSCHVQPMYVSFVDGVALVAGWNGKIHAMNVQTGIDKEIGEHKNLTDSTVSGDNRYLMTVSPNGILRFWDLDRDTKPEDCDTKPSLVQSLASLPGEQGFITGDRAGKLELWSLYGRKRVREIGKLRSGTKVVRISRDGTQLAAVSYRWLTLWSLPEGKKIAEVACPTPVNMLEFSPDGKWLAVATGDGPPAKPASVWLWETATGKKVKEFRGHKALVRAIAFDVESNSLVTGGDDMTLRVWKIPR